MTNDHNPEGTTPDVPDATLQRLVDLATMADDPDDERVTEFNFDLTLVVDGLLVDGQLVSGKRWFDEVSSKTGRDSGIEQQMNLDTLFSLEHEFYAAKRGVPYRFLHLDDAVVDGALGPQRVGWIRLRLNRISGWTPGRPASRAGAPATRRSI